MRKKISSLINLIINLILFILNLLIIFFSLRKIYKNNITIIQNHRIGFGNIFTSVDLARKIFKNKILFIHFYDASRFHNKMIFDFLGEKKIILYSSVYFKSRKTRYGEYDQYGRNTKENFFQNILIKVIKFLSDSGCKFYTILDLYNLAKNKFLNLNVKKYYNTLPGQMWLNYYFYLIKKNPKIKINKKNPLLSKIIQSQKKIKTICIYIRNKKSSPKQKKSYSFYFNIINYLNNKNFRVYLVGEYDEFIRQYPKVIDKIKLPIKKNKKKDINLSLAYQLTSDYYLGDQGGGGWFAMYKKHSVIIDGSEGFYLPNVKIFYYQIYLKGKRIYKKSKVYKDLLGLMKKYDHHINEAIFDKSKFTIQTEDSSIMTNYIKKKF